MENTESYLLPLRRVPVFIWVAFLVRLVWAAVVPVDPVSDGVVYRLFADSIASGAGYAYPTGEATVFWPVGASAFYALVFRVFGASHWPVVGVNVLIGVGIVYLSYLLALRYFDATIARRAAWLVALWPVFIQFTTVYASELLFTLFLLAAIAVWGSLHPNRVVKSAIWGGLLCAATYVRPTALPLFLLLPALEFLKRRNIREVLVSAIFAWITAAILFAPWVIRNQQVFEQPVLVSANFGSNLWMGNNPQSKGDYMPLPTMKFDNEVVRDQYFKRLAVDYIVQHPAEYVRLSLRRLLITYERETIGVAWNAPALEKLLGSSGLPYVKALSSLYWLVCFAGAVCWVLWAFFSRRISALNPLLVVSAFFFVVPVLTVGQDRYHLPMIPFVAIFAALGIKAVQQYWLTRKTR